MKKVMCFYLFCFIPFCSIGQNVCWYSSGSKLCYEVSATKLLVKSEKLDVNSLKSAIESTHIGILKDIYDMGTLLYYVMMQNTSVDDFGQSVPPIPLESVPVVPVKVYQLNPC